jgi:hypothetical protein
MTVSGKVNPKTKWTPTRRAKFIATMKAKSTAKRNGKGAPQAHERVHDAIVWLRHAETSATRRLRAGQLKRFDESHIYATLALRALEGE